MTDNIETKVEAQAAPAVPEVTQAAQANQAETESDKNWRLFRQQREEERKQKEAAEKYAKQKEEESEALKRAMEALVNKPSQQNDYRNEDPAELTQEQIIEKRVEEAISKREKLYQEQRAVREQAELPQRLVSNFSDFNEVCTTENLDYLEYHYPEVAGPYKHLPEGYDKWSGLYKALKRFIPNKNAVKDSKKMEQNLAKPQAMSRPGMTQTGDHAPQMALNDDRKKQNWERMQKIMGKGSVG